MAEKKKILYIVEAMGGGVFTYIVDLANELVNKYDMYIAYAVRKQTPKNYKDYRTTAIKYAVNADVFLLPSRWEGLPISLLDSILKKEKKWIVNFLSKFHVCNLSMPMET